MNKRDDEFDVSTELEGYGLQGVKVTDDDLAALVQELGLGGDEADDLVKGLSTPAPESKKADPQAALMAELSAKIKPTTKGPAEVSTPKPVNETAEAISNESETKQERDTTETKSEEASVERAEEALSKATE